MIAGRGGGKRWTVERRLRALPAPRRAQAERRRAALGRRAADARDRPRAADEPDAARHGRAVRGARAGDRRAPDRDVPRRSSEEGLAILLIEQNLGVATAIAERQLVMVAGSIAAETTAAELSTRHRAAAPLPRRRAARGAGLSERRSSCSARSTRRAASTRSCATGCASTASTCSSSTRACTSRSGSSPTSSRDEVARAGRRRRRGARSGGRPRRRGRRRWARAPRRSCCGCTREGALDGILALGGSGGSSIAARAMRALPVGVPKLLVSTRRLGRHAAVRRRRRRDDDVLGRRHLRRQPHLGADHGERRRRDRRHGRRDGAGARGQAARRRDACSASRRRA